MTHVRPISDLRNKSREISDLCHETGEPVLITKDGKEDLVVMSMAAWQRDQARLELYRALDESEIYERAGNRGLALQTVRKRLGR